MKITPDRRAKVGIIGAGMAGLSAARVLADYADVTLFDKSRGVGGRMSTRYAGDYEFDHGAQYFTITDPGFQVLIDEVARGSSAQWDSRGLYVKDGRSELDTGRPRWVGSPRMNALPKALAAPFQIELSRRVTEILGRDNALSLKCEDGPDEGPFDYVICSVPAPQAADLVRANSPVYAQLDQVKMRACFALMIGLEEPVDLEWDTLRVSDLPVSWLSVNSSKPGRPEKPICLVAHASPEWSDTHKDDDRERVETTMLDCAADLCGFDPNSVDHTALHRWLYAYADEGIGEPHLTDPKTGVIFAGDWCLGGRVEGAFQSGRSAGEAVLERLRAG